MGYLVGCRGREERGTLYILNQSDLSIIRGSLGCGRGRRDPVGGEHSCSCEHLLTLPLCSVLNVIIYVIIRTTGREPSKYGHISALTC